MSVIFEGSLVFLQENPGLGPARIVARGSSAELLMLFSGARHPIRRESKIDLFPFYPGVKVVFVTESSTEEGEVILSLPQRPNQRRRVRILVGGRAVEVDEATLNPCRPEGDDLPGRLRMLQWDHPRAFFARRGLLQQQKVWYEDTEGLPTLTGARVRFMAHQLYAVQRVLWARTPRFVLADEVGLGKTIEAGLVIQALLSANPELSILVIAPGSMSRQWLCELYLRFGARPFQSVNQLDAPLGDKLIISTTTLSRQPKAWKHLTSRRWGLVVIDEAHQHPPGSALYSLFRQLSENCDGILVLSATPSKREIQGILGLLALVAPDQYGPGDEARLADLWAQRREIWDRLGYHQALRVAPDFLKMPASELAAIADDWEPLLAEDEVAGLFLGRLRQGERAAFDELEAYVQEHYRVDHRIVRTRRKTVQALGQRLSERTLEVVEYMPTAEEALFVEHIETKISDLAGIDTAHRALGAIYLRLLRYTPDVCLTALEARLCALRNGQRRGVATSWWDELLSDPSPEEEEQLRENILREVEPFPGELRWLEHALELAKAWRREGALGARHESAIAWVQAHLRNHPKHKLLVFTECREVAKAFAAALGERIGRTVEAFHWVGPEGEEQLKRITSEFQRNPNRPVLVSDELGGEGRNFQMAEAVLHLDCPWAVARLEQRIGRLDRIGRDADRAVRSVVFLGKGTIERELHEVNAHIFKVHQRSIGGLEFLLPDLQRRVCESAAAGAHALATRREALAHEVEQAFGEVDQDLDQSLDTSRHELERARELASLLEEIDGANRCKPIQHWARTLGLDAELRQGSDGASEYRFRWTPSELQVPLAGQWGMVTRQDTGTFDRKQALVREDLQYFAPGHRLIDAQIGTMRSTHIGRLTIFGRDLGRAHRRHVFALVLVHFDLDPSIWTPEPFDAGLLTRARRRLYPEVIERSLRLDPALSLATLVEAHALSTAIEAEYCGQDSVIPVGPAALTDFEVGPLSGALQEAMRLAVESAAEERLRYANEALEELAQDLAPEIGFLHREVGRGDRVDAARALRQRHILLENLTRSRVEVAGVAVIFGR